MTKKRLVQAINDAIVEEMTRDDKIILFGEDVEISLFGDTRGLKDRFGSRRVRNTPISEALLTGAATGAAASGYRVICHLMFGNFIYTGFDAIANQVAKLPYMTNNQISLPIVFMAVIGGGRSTGAQHSDVPYPAVVNLGGIKVVVPSSPADAKGLMKSSIRDPGPVFYLQAAGRGGELGDVDNDPEWIVPLGVADIKRSGSDVTIVAIGSMVRLAMDAAVELSKMGIESEVIDPRTLVPLDFEAIANSVQKTGRLVVVDEARRSCGMAAEIASLSAERLWSSLKGPIMRVTTPDVCLPYAPNLEKVVLPNANKVIKAVMSTIGVGE